MPFKFCLRHLQMVLQSKCDSHVAPISGHKSVSALQILQVKEADLIILLSPVGFVWEVTIPQKDDGKFI